jgi:hypothetical protein
MMRSFKILSEKENARGGDSASCGYVTHRTIVIPGEDRRDSADVREGDPGG